MTAALRLITPPRLRTLFAEDPELELIDVRTPDEFEEAHIPGARNFPLGSLVPGELLSEEAVSRNRPVYLVCQTDNRSRIAADKFLAAGHSRVFVVSGGTLAWIAAPLPVARGDSSKEWLARNLTARNQNSTDRREASVPSGRTT